MSLVVVGWLFSSHLSSLCSSEVLSLLATSSVSLLVFACMSSGLCEIWDETCARKIHMFYSLLVDPLYSSLLLPHSLMHNPEKTIGLVLQYHLIFDRDESKCKHSFIAAKRVHRTVNFILLSFWNTLISLTSTFATLNPSNGQAINQ